MSDIVIIESVFVLHFRVVRSIRMLFLQNLEKVCELAANNIRDYTERNAVSNTTWLIHPENNDICLG